MKPLTRRNVRPQLGPARSVLLLVTASSAMYLAPFASADTIYSYTGKDYTTCGGTYCTGGPYALSVTLRTTLTGHALHELPFTDITATVISYEFTDGTGLTFASSINPAAELDVRIATDDSANIVAWFVGAYSFPAEIQMQTNWDSPFSFVRGADFSETAASFARDYGLISNDPGTWEMTAVAIPEPSTFVLLALPLLLVHARATGRRIA